MGKHPDLISRQLFQRTWVLDTLIVGQLSMDSVGFAPRLKPGPLLQCNNRTKRQH